MDARTASRREAVKPFTPSLFAMRHPMDRPAAAARDRDSPQRAAVDGIGW
jgi:hypothetical protein